MKTSTLQRIRAILAETLGVPIGDKARVDELRDVAAVDSVVILQFAVALERQFGIRLDDHWNDDWMQTERLLNLNALAAYIDQVQRDDRAPRLDQHQPSDS